jgi:sporulation protein YlmC with PRC-barrel domain
MDIFFNVIIRQLGHVSFSPRHLVLSKISPLHGQENRLCIVFFYCGASFDCSPVEITSKELRDHCEQFFTSWRHNDSCNLNNQVRYAIEEESVMRIEEGEPVFTSEGEVAGKVNRIVLDPKTKEITHIVVKEGTLFTDERVIPISLVEYSDDNALKLRQTPVDFDAFPVYQEIHYIPVNNKPTGTVERTLREYYHLFPYPLLDIGNSELSADRQKDLLKTRIENIPERSMALDQGAIVRDVDGERFGKVDEILTDTENDRATYLVISSGWIFKKRILVPINWVLEFGEDEVKLAVDTRILKGLHPFKPDTA